MNLGSVTISTNQWHGAIALLQVVSTPGDSGVPAERPPDTIHIRRVFRFQIYTRRDRHAAREEIGIVCLRGLRVANDRVKVTAEIVGGWQVLFGTVPVAGFGILLVQGLVRGIAAGNWPSERTPQLVLCLFLALAVCLTVAGVAAALRLAAVAMTTRRRLRSLAASPIG